MKTLAVAFDQTSRVKGCADGARLLYKIFNGFAKNIDLIQYNEQCDVSFFLKEIERNRKK